MILVKRLIFRTPCKLCKLKCFSGINSNNFISKAKFTNEEQEKILNALNTYNVEQLSRFDVTQTRVKSLDKRRNKEGPFKTLTEVLEVDGLGFKVLEKLCDSIVSETMVHKTNGVSKSRRQFLSPTLLNEQDLRSAVGFHLGANGISWAKLSTDNKSLEDWNYIDFSSNPKKMLPWDTFKLANHILDRIPTGNAYVFEASANMSPQSNKPPSIITAYNQQLELTSMLFALINTSEKHNIYLKCEGENSNSIYYLKSNLSARLFKTLMGSERVSSTETVTNILQNCTGSLQCSTIAVSKSLQQQYYSQSPVLRELLGQALLLIITFMDICVFKTPISLMAVMPGRR